MSDAGSKCTLEDWLGIDTPSLPRKEKDCMIVSLPNLKLLFFFSSLSLCPSQFSSSYFSISIFPLFLHTSLSLSLIFYINVPIQFNHGYLILLPQRRSKKKNPNIHVNSKYCLTEILESISVTFITLTIK